jgi:hypothetical protein
MLAACQLHKAGIRHSRLMDHSHILVSKDTDFFNYPRNNKFGVCFVGFSSAIRHACSLQASYPALQRQRPPSGQCDELVMMEKLYGVYSGETVQPPGMFSSMGLPW